MIDINLIRNSTDNVKENIKKRSADYPPMIDEVLKLDEDWRKKKQELDDLRSHRNTISQAINEAKKAGKDTAELTKEAQELPNKVRDVEIKADDLKEKIRQLLLTIPNLIDDSVPVGKDETENKVIKEFGEKHPATFNLKSHVDLLPEQGWVELEHAAKISGARWYFLQEELAILEMALTRYGIDFMRSKGFTFVVPPHMMSHKPYEGVTDMGTFEDALYKIEGEDLYVIATSEHPLTAQFMNEVLEENQLPITMVGYSTNFRKEAGSHGKDTKGIFRVHQFNKVEQIVICTPEQSAKFHETITQHAIEFWESLGIPFRQMLLCTADTGVVMAKTYDLEAWYPVQQAYREVVSSSNATDYQARRLNIKYMKDNERHLVHTLNSTLIATSRALVAIVENFQRQDGSIHIPKVLQKYTGFDVMSAKK